MSEAEISGKSYVRINELNGTVVYRCECPDKGVMQKICDKCAHALALRLATISHA